MFYLNYIRYTRVSQVKLKGYSEKRYCIAKNFQGRKTFANFVVLWLYTKVFSTKFGAWCPLAWQKRAICESFLPWKFPAIWYYLQTRNLYNIYVRFILIHYIDSEKNHITPLIPQIEFAKEKLKSLAYMIRLDQIFGVSGDWIQCDTGHFQSTVAPNIENRSQ